MSLLLKTKNKIFIDLKKDIENFLKKEILLMGKKTILRDAIEYALLNGGKRFRPIIVLLIAKAINKNYPAIQAALSCEFFHTASLIADDLPCMDDEKERRCKAALHLKFNEATAILASFTLISSGYELIYKNAKTLEKKISKEKSNEICMKAIETVSKYAGIEGATGGQFLDLFAKDITLDTIIEIIHKKTISLFEISFVLGWLYGGGDLDKLDLVKKAAYHFGMAFQIADDIKDLKEDLEKNKYINIAISIGEEKAKKLFFEEINNTKKLLKELNIYSKDFFTLVSFLEKRV
ncbi:MAG: Farnesyl diphosphate synthase [Candidatus Anoxychlamydiales bacterium]|nr:Farnesyl diphosphate synthase [Candidatus Anoxychlamydiales bacterium]HEU64728.1 polyprenyl synthetase family protein [Chlamydiota bacterium]